MKFFPLSQHPTNPFYLFSILEKIKRKSTGKINRKKKKKRIESFVKASFCRFPSGTGTNLKFQTPQEK